MKGPLYAQTAGQVKEAGDGAGAVQVLHAGAQRFPQDTDITKAIEQAKVSGDSDELKKLKSLGYVQ